MALERPGMDETLERNLKRVDFVLACCFFFEVALKCFAFGVKRYLREKVNRLDMAIALFTVLEICLVSVFSGLSAIRSLRILRAIRPLRALTKSHGMRLVLKSVALSMGAMVNVSAVLLLVFAVFGILGVQIFAGRFYRCDDPFVEFRAECVGTYVEPVTGITKNRVWKNAYLNFDSLPNALVSLFVASTLDGYGQLLFDGLDATNIDEQPRRDANPAAFAFFLAFIVLCAFQSAQPVRGRHLLPVLTNPHAEPDVVAGPFRGAEGVGGDVQDGAADAPEEENASSKKPAAASALQNRVARKV
jgi:hypothetical protein